MQHQDGTRNLDETVVQPDLHASSDKTPTQDDDAISGGTPTPARQRPFPVTDSAARTQTPYGQGGFDAPTDPSSKVSQISEADHVPYRQKSQATTASDSGSGKGVWSEFSFASVIASALASVTSVLLMNRIGIGGSLIGVGVAAGASALASQIYKGVLSSSAEKLKNAAEQQAQSTESPWEQDDSEDAQAGEVTVGTDGTRLMPHPVTLSDKTGPHAQAASGTPIAPEAMRAAAARRQSTVTRRRIVIVCLVASLAAVALVAVIISVATQGTGLGPTYSAPAQTATTEQTSTTSQTGSAPQQPEAPARDTSSTTDDGAKTTSDDAATTTTDSDSTSDTTGDSGSSTTSNTSGTTSNTSSNSSSNATTNGSTDSSSTDSSNSSSSKSTSDKKDTSSSTTSTDSGTSTTGGTTSSTSTKTTSSTN